MLGLDNYIVIVMLGNHSTDMLIRLGVCCWFT